MLNFIPSILSLIEKLNPVILFFVWNEEAIAWQELLIMYDLTHLRIRHTTMARYPWGWVS